MSTAPRSNVATVAVVVLLSLRATMFVRASAALAEPFTRTWSWCAPLMQPNHMQLEKSASCAATGGRPFARKMPSLVGFVYSALPRLVSVSTSVRVAYSAVTSPLTTV
jgi:hypothetical protein